MNKLTKELVATYRFTSADSDFILTPVELCERINGFDYYAHVPRTNITVVGNVYRLDPSDEQPNNYMLLCGVSYQDPDDYNPNDEQETEVAAIRAQLRPQIIMYFNDMVDEETFNNISYVMYLQNHTPMNPKVEKVSIRLSQDEKDNALNYAFEKYN